MHNNFAQYYTVRKIKLDVTWIFFLFLVIH